MNQTERLLSEILSELKNINGKLDSGNLNEIINPNGSIQVAMRDLSNSLNMFNP